jgi:hypothetical protein
MIAVVIVVCVLLAMPTRGPLGVDTVCRLREYRALL